MGNDLRFRALFERAYPSVVRYSYNRGYRGADAEDLVAATFEVAWRRLVDVPEGERELPWLLTVTRNLSFNARRRDQRERDFVRPLAEPDSGPPSGGVEDGAVARDQLLAALGALKETDREMILLVAWDGLSPARAGEVLGLGPGAARSRLHRARNQLARLLGLSARPRRVNRSNTQLVTIKEDKGGR